MAYYRRIYRHQPSAGVRLIRRRDRLRNAPRPGHRTRNAIGGLLVVLVVVFAAMTVATSAAAVVSVSALEQGLPDPTTLDKVTFAQPTKVYDRTGQTLLAEFSQENRRVITFNEIPHFLLDATTSAEDHSFWTNIGVDPVGIVGAVFQNASAGADQRGASTITQQLVRAVLLPPDVVAPDANQYVRKMKEIIQSIRLTAAYSGEAGKEKIITYYLNDVFYGHGAYGIAAAATTYFGVSDLSKLTVAQAALLAGLVKSPTTLDPYNYAQPDSKGNVVVPQTADPVVRRNYILGQMGQFARFTKLTQAQLSDAMKEPVVLHPQPARPMLAPQFDLQVRAQLDQILGSDKAVETGGYKVITSLDYAAQQLAEKWVAAYTILPNETPAKAAADIKAMGIDPYDQTYINYIRGSDLHNGAMVAMDPRTGQVLAYVGSAGYYRTDIASAKFAPQYDVLQAARQPGSAWKPIMYSTGFEQHVLTPGTLLIDAATPLAPGYTPHDADLHERGPVLLRGALQYSLNIPAMKAYARVGSQAVTAQAYKMGITFPGGPNMLNDAGLAGAIGTVEVRMFDMTSAFGVFANGGVRVPPQMVLEIDGPDGKAVYKAPTQNGQQALSPQSSFLISNILEQNTNNAPDTQNILWGPQFFINNGPNGAHRPAAMKTGTTNDFKDLTTFGYIAPPADPNAPGLVVGVWIGNSDNSAPQGRVPVFAVDGPAHIWKAFVRDYTAGRPVTDFSAPPGVIQSTIDAFSGGAPGPWTRATVQEWFLEGTQPGGPQQIDHPGILYTPTCGTYAVDTAKAEAAAGSPKSWVEAARQWMVRASHHVVPFNSETPGPSYFYTRSSFGGPFSVSCHVEVAPAEPTPPPSPSATAPPAPTPPPTPAPTPPPTQKHKPGPTPPPSAAPAGTASSPSNTAVTTTTATLASTSPVAANTLAASGPTTSSSYTLLGVYDVPPAPSTLIAARRRRARKARNRARRPLPPQRGARCRPEP